MSLSKKWQNPTRALRPHFPEPHRDRQSSGPSDKACSYRNGGTKYTQPGAAITHGGPGWGHCEVLWCGLCRGVSSAALETRAARRAHKAWLGRNVWSPSESLVLLSFVTVNRGQDTSVSLECDSVGSVLAWHAQGPKLVLDTLAYSNPSRTEIEAGGSEGLGHPCL